MLRESARSLLNAMMYAENEVDFVGYFNAFKDKFEINYTIFYLYFMNQWIPKKDLWSKVYREVKSELQYT